MMGGIHDVLIIYGCCLTIKCKRYIKVLTFDCLIDMFLLKNVSLIEIILFCSLFTHMPYHSIQTNEI